MFKIKKFSALSISVLLSITTLFSCSFTDREKVDFVKEEKIHELNKVIMLKILHLLIMSLVSSRIRF